MMTLGVLTALALILTGLALIFPTRTLQVLAGAGLIVAGLLSLAMIY